MTEKAIAQDKIQYSQEHFVRTLKSHILHFITRRQNEKMKNEILENNLCGIILFCINAEYGCFKLVKLFLVENR